MSDRHGFSTRAIHNRLTEPSVKSRPLATPIFQTASFAFDDSAELAAAIASPEDAFVYSRLSNPTVDVVERAIADLEGAETGLGTASGMAAISAAALACVRAGDQIACAASVYGGSYGLYARVLERLGVQTVFVPNDDLDAWEVAAKDPRTKLLHAETISNPTLRVADLRALSEIAHAQGARLLVDSTFATPYLCRPLELGADLVVHSASKYFGGHGDLIAGIVVGERALMKRAKSAAHDLGGTMAPFVAWLILRGLKTLSLRMDRHGQSARVIAEHLERHPGVTRTYYPGLASHPDHALAAERLAHGFGGMVAFELPGDRDAVAARLDRLTLIERAGSLGDAHSLVLQPAATSHRQLDAEALRVAGMAEGLVRLSVGLEDVEDLVADLDRALT